MENTIVSINFCTNFRRIVIFGPHNLDLEVRRPVIALLHLEEFVILRLRLGMEVVDARLVQTGDVDLGLIEDVRLGHRTDLRLTSALADGSESLHVTALGPCRLDVSPDQETRMLSPQFRTRNVRSNP